MINLLAHLFSFILQRRTLARLYCPSKDSGTGTASWILYILLHAGK